MRIDARLFHCFFTLPYLTLPYLTLPYLLTYLLLTYYLLILFALLCFTLLDSVAFILSQYLLAYLFCRVMWGPVLDQGFRLYLSSGWKGFFSGHVSCRVLMGFIHGHLDRLLRMGPNHSLEPGFLHIPSGRRGTIGIRRMVTATLVTNAFF